jgi:hypothetical protein
MTNKRRDRGVTTVEWVIVAMIIGVGGIAVFRTFKDSYMEPTAVRMGNCIEAAAGDGNLCGGLAAGGASNGGGGNAAGGNGAGAATNGVGGNGATENGNGGGMTANELAGSVGNGNGHAAAGGEAGHAGQNPNAETVNRIGWGMGLAAAGEDALIDIAKERSGITSLGSLENAVKAARAAEGALIAVPLDLIANGVPHNPNDAASLGTKTAIAGAMGWFGGPVGAVAAVGLDKSLGYVADSITGGNRYASDYEDSIAWHMVHGVPGTIGKEGMEQAEANRQQLVHEQLDYMRQQRERDAEALREMMGGGRR